jgi:hypothetical protein
MSKNFVHLPKSVIFARYAPQPGAGVAVVNLAGEVLAPSFFELRHRFEFVASIAGAGGWVALAPLRSSSFPQERAIQPALF